MGSLPLSVLQTGLVIALVASCGSRHRTPAGDRQSPRPKPKPAPAEAPLETAIVATESGLVSINAKGIVKEVIELPQIAKSACTEEPDDCGKARQLGSSDYYLVITANSRGDYYHEDKNMYFGLTEEFFDPATDTKRLSPFKESLQEADIFLSPSEELLLYEGSLYSGIRGTIGRVEGEACGFVGGGRRYGTTIYDDGARP